MKLKILNLNIMHGRNTKTPVWPVFLPKEQVLKNLHEIAEVIKKYDPDIVTLQEVDRNSLSNGKLDELKELNLILKYPYTLYGNHFRSPFATFGTAILSKYPLSKTVSKRFLPALPTPRKGFIIADVELGEGTMVSLVSLHTTWINYLYPNTRPIQLKKIKKALEGRNNPRIVSGDFNDEMISTKNTTLRNFVEDMRVKAYLPLSTELKTYPSSQPRERIDWVLVSEEINFVEYSSPQELISDHLPILTTVEIK